MQQKIATEELPDLFGGTDGLSLRDPLIHLGPFDCNLRGDPGMEDPSPYTPRPAEPQQPGGTPPGPNQWWKPPAPQRGPFPGGFPGGSDFSPEQIQRQADERARKRQEAEQRKKDAEDMLRNARPPAPADDNKGDYNIPPNETYIV